MQGLVRRGLTAAIATLAVTWLLAAIAQHADDIARGDAFRSQGHRSDLGVGADRTELHGYLVYDTLFALDADMKAQPQMVAQLQGQRRQAHLHLRPARWPAVARRKACSAADCVQSIKRWAERDGVGQRLMQATKDLEAVDDKTFRLTLKEPYGFVIESFAKPGSTAPFMMPKRIADTPGTQQIRDATGSGPFIFKADEWKPGEKVVYVKNPNYKPRAEPPSGLAGGKVPKIDRIEWLVMPDVQTAVNALQNNEIDVIEALPPDLLPMLQANKSIVYQRGKYPGQYTFRLNWLHPPFDNPKIREAAGYAIDQKPFLDAQVGDEKFYQVCKAYFICGTPLATTEGMDGRLEGNVAKARELLKEAGYDGTPVVLMRTTDLAALVNLAPVAKAQLREGRLQGRHAIGGLADHGQPDEQAGRAGQWRLEPLPHELGRARLLEPDRVAKPQRVMREGDARLALRQEAGGAARPVRACAGSRAAEEDRDGDPGPCRDLGHALSARRVVRHDGPSHQQQGLAAAHERDAVLECRENRTLML